MTETVHDSHVHAADAVARRLGVVPNQGLSADEVDLRRQRHGPNRLPEAAPRRWWQRVLDQFRDFMILVLLAAAVVSGLIGDLTDTVVILIIVVLNATIGVWQEWRADQALQALRRMAAPHAMVRRDGGQVQQVETQHLVPGDVVLLEAGNLVPADLRLHEVAQLKVDESALTGESVTIDKQHARAGRAGRRRQRARRPHQHGLQGHPGHAWACQRARRGHRRADPDRPGRHLAARRRRTRDAVAAAAGSRSASGCRWWCSRSAA